ncbi:MAG TPA: outer membrane lipoprotein-sorting protein [Myxococcales bacterium]|nr:outer membrane lipoprotein-sorting protein [Myxococcales bacterium]
MPAGRLAALALAVLASPSAIADPAAPKLSPAEILARMEATNNDYADQMLNERLTVVDVDGTRRSYDLTFRQKGTKRLVEFTSGESNGMAVLVEDRNDVYVYLPGFRKVRRVSASSMNESMVGSDLSSDDMATVSWAERYDVKLEKEDDTSWWLALTPKPGVESNYGRIVHRVGKAHFLQQETHWFDKAGQEVKRLVSSEPTSYDGVIRNKLAIFSDPRTGHRTELETTSAKYNQGLGDELFTVRQLQWGR